MEKIKSHLEWEFNIFIFHAVVFTLTGKCYVKIILAFIVRSFVWSEWICVSI